MSLTREDVLKLAQLARLELPEEELKSMESDLDRVLDYVGKLASVDTKDVEPYGLAPRVEWRKDEAIACDDVARETLLANFPARKGDLLHTPGVFVNPKH